MEMTFTGKLVTVTCWCGMFHAVPSGLREYQLREHDNGRDFEVYCPLGHRYFPSGDSRYDKEVKRTQRLERQLANREEDLRAERASHAATKGTLTKAKKRAARGVCPCCHRSFVNVARHVAHMHPEALSD